MQHRSLKIFLQCLVWKIYSMKKTYIPTTIERCQADICPTYIFTSVHTTFPSSVVVVYKFLIHVQVFAEESEALDQIAKEVRSKEVCTLLLILYRGLYQCHLTNLRIKLLKTKFVYESHITLCQGNLKSKTNILINNPKMMVCYVSYIYILMNKSGILLLL